MTNKIESRKERVIEEARYLVKLRQSQPEITVPERGIFGYSEAEILSRLDMAAVQFNELRDGIRKIGVALELLDEAENG